MKLTKESLKQIIKEELDAMLAEDTIEEGDQLEEVEQLEEAEEIEEAMANRDQAFMKAYQRAKEEMPNATPEQIASRAYNLLRGAQ
jgi:hypothetical protein